MSKIGFDYKDVQLSVLLSKKIREDEFVTALVAGLLVTLRNIPEEHLPQVRDTARGLIKTILGEDLN